MNIEQAKRIKLEKFLMKLGMEPVKTNGNRLWYHSPFRKEEVPSFIVDVNNNIWFDQGTDKGGSIIELAKQLYQTDIMPFLLDKIDEVAPVVPPTKFDILSLTGLEESVKFVTLKN